MCDKIDYIHNIQQKLFVFYIYFILYDCNSIKKRRFFLDNHFIIYN